MKSKIISALMLALVSSAAFAATSAPVAANTGAGDKAKAVVKSAALKQGAWTMDIERQIEGKPTAEPAISNKECVTDKNGDPAALLAGRLASDPACKVVNTVDDKGAGKVTMSCTLAAAKVTGDGSYTLSEKAFKGEIKLTAVDTSSKDATGKQSFTVKISGKHTGACASEPVKAPESAKAAEPAKAAKAK